MELSMAANKFFLFSIVPISCEIYMHFDCLGCFLMLVVAAIAASLLWCLDIGIDFRVTFWLFIELVTVFVSAFKFRIDIKINFENVCHEIVVAFQWAGLLQSLQQHQQQQ